MKLRLSDEDKERLQYSNNILCWNYEDFFRHGHEQFSDKQIISQVERDILLPTGTLNGYSVLYLEGNIVVHP